MIRVFVGFDWRQPVSYQVLHHSILRRASVPVSITPLHLPQLPIERQGLTPFTYSRYLVPWLCNYDGHAIFMDSDMLCLCDIKELWEKALEPLDNARVAVRQFAGDRTFERPSLMAFNNAVCTELTPERINDPRYHPQAFEWAGWVGPLPEQYNRLVGYEDCSDAKILHYTAGVPAWPQTQKLGHAEVWLDELNASTGIAPWEDLMGNSVHMKNLGLGNERDNTTAG